VPAEGRPLVATVVPSWNRRADTLACLASLERLATPGFDHRAVLVDNGSADGTVAEVAARFPEVSCLALGENLGFARAVNVGIRAALAAGADWVMLLNNDTVVDPDLLLRLLGEVADRPDVGLAAPTVYYFDRPDRVWPSAGRRRALTLAPFDTTAQPPVTGSYDIDWATGCCLLIRRAVVDEVGLLDERYHFFYEDHDYCLRSRAAGWRIVHVPAARVWHRVSASAGQGTALQLYLLGRASVPFYWRHTRGLQRAAMLPYRAGSLLRTTTRCLAAGRPDAARAYARGLLHGWADATSTDDPDPAARSMTWATSHYADRH
jgi:GT2 family glycosyltransferase